MNKPKDFWIIMVDKPDSAHISTEALIYFDEPTHGAIKGLAMHVREVIESGSQPGAKEKE